MQAFGNLFLSLLMHFPWSSQDYNTHAKLLGLLTSFGCIKLNVSHFSCHLFFFLLQIWVSSLDTNPQLQGVQQNNSARTFDISLLLCIAQSWYSLLLLWHLEAFMPTNNCQRKKAAGSENQPLTLWAAFSEAFHEQIYFPCCLYGTRQSWSCLGLLASMALQTFISMTNRILRQNEDKMIVQAALTGVKAIL